jgi:hypothetical protein
MRPLSNTALILLTAITMVAPARAQTLLSGRPPQAVAATDPLHQAGRNVTISLLTMGNGKEVWELFGHAAIWIHDDVTNRDTVFNWGVFDSHQPHFIVHFLQGLMLYRMGGDSMDQTLYAYHYLNRTLTAQELDLSAAEKDSLLHLIRTNAEPQNLTYRYDYFVDNCSTRPRDLLDAVLGGQLRAQTNRPSGTTYRWHTIRLMQGDVPLMLGVDIGLGEPSDREITQWQEMFLPRALHDFVATLKVRDGTGAMHPLVRSERVLYQATGRDPEPGIPPALSIWLWPAGAVVALLLGLLGVKAIDGGPAVRGTAAAAFALWCVTIGLLGTLLTILWTATDHVFAYANENLLLFNPIWLVLAVLAPINLWTGRAARATRVTARILGGLSALALVAHIVSLSRQANLPIVGLGLLPSLAIAIVVGWPAAEGRRASSAATDAATREGAIVTP